MIPPKRFDISPQTGGCSEGLDAFRIFFKKKNVSHPRVRAKYSCDLMVLIRTARSRLKNVRSVGLEARKTQDLLAAPLVQPNHYSLKGDKKKNQHYITSRGSQLRRMQRLRPKVTPIADLALLQVNALCCLTCHEKSERAHRLGRATRRTLLWMPLSHQWS